MWGTPQHNQPRLNLVVKSFWAAYSPNPGCVLNLKLLALTIAEISRDPNFFRMLPYLRHPPILVLNVVSW